MSRDYLFANKKKSFWDRKLFYIALIAIFAFGYWLVSGDSEPKQPQNDGIMTNVNVSEDIGTNYDSNKDNNSNLSGNDGENDVLSADSDAYYLLKESEGQIELYYYNNDGEETFLKVTDIPYPLISESDQKKFKAGIILENEGELAELLQDFES